MRVLSRSAVTFWHRAGLAFSLCCAVFPAGLQAQTSSAGQPCVDSLLQNCDNTPATDDPALSATTPNQTSTPQTRPQDNSDTRVYVDSAGNLTTRRTSTPANNNSGTAENPLFPPDPVTDLQRLAKSSTGETLPIFGRDFFRTVPSTFAPGDQIAVTPDYIVGPGDELLVRFWGPETFNSQLTVDRSGAIYIPKVGSIHVAGLRFDELQKQISAEMSSTYRNFTLTVNLGRLRSIQVYVVGEARRPGAYTVSSLSTVLNALFASGGPNVQGSLRHIQIRRSGVTLPDFDLYDLVLHGDKSQDVRLMSGDTIFIPPVGPQVALGGSVRHPAIYELKGKSGELKGKSGELKGKSGDAIYASTLGDILNLAGGLSATAGRAQVTLERIEDHHAREALSVALDGAGLAMPLRDGDVIYAPHITAGYEQSVTIRGNLANPGRFPWHEGMRLSEIIPDRQSLLTNDYWRERNRLGVPVPLFQPLVPNAGRVTPERGSADGAAAQTESTPLYDRNGRVIPYDGRSDSADQGTLSDADVAAQSYNQRTSGAAGDATPATNPDGSPRTSSANAAPGTISEQNEYDTENLHRPKTRIRIAVPEINWSYAAIERLNPDTLRSSVVPFNLGRLVQDHDPSQDLELRPGDVVTILSQNDVLVPLDLQTKYVRIEGEFAAAGVYSVGPDETLDQLVARAGGLTSKAYLYGSSFTRESARVFQQQRLDEYITTLSADMERAAAVRTASSASGVVDPNALAEQRSLISQLRQLRATGRVVLEFGPRSEGVASIPKIPLNNGDVFRVPSRPNTVSVVGAVYGQNVFLYNRDRRLEDYVDLAGKPNRIADRKHAFIIRADGSIYSRERAAHVFSNTFDSAEINPGDSIVIPEKLIRPTALRQLIDYSQILSSFGLAAAAINVIK